MCPPLHSNPGKIANCPFALFILPAKFITGIFDYVADSGSKGRWRHINFLRLLQQSFYKLIQTFD